MNLKRRWILLLAAAAFACKDPAPATGTMVVNVTGLPSGAAALVRITGPDGFFRTLNSSGTLEKLVPGEYVVRIDTIVHSDMKYGAAVIRDTVQVVAGETLTQDVPYTLSSGSLTLTINGLPMGTPADARVVGQNFSSTVIQTGTLAGLAPGRYYIQSDTFATVLGDRYGSDKILDSVDVVASLTPAAASVSYQLVSATLALTVTGLPGNFSQQPITVTGPNSFSRKYGASNTIRGLPPGSYTITAQTANGVCPTIYRTSPTPQNIDLTIGNTGNVTVNYAEGTADPADLNLKIESVHIIQVTQNPQWTVPMVAGRPALVRVFGIANQCNTATPKVRLTIGSAPPVEITAPESSVRSTTEVGVLNSTWNYEVPAQLVQEPMSIVAEIDHDGAVAETDESDNRYPSSGSRPVIVKTVPTIGIRFVPISQTVNGVLQTGSIEGKVDQFMLWSKRMHPVANFDVVVREPYTTKAGPLQPTDGTNWEAVLGEIELLRQADDPPELYYRYHYGVAKVTYTQGIAGIGYVAGKAALGWDHLQFESATSVMAHELGHNFGRSHSPCGGPNPQTIDPNFPKNGFYAGGGIGVYGYDQTTKALKSPEIYTDLMGYCNAQWISDYMYMGILNYLSDPDREPSMSVAGRSVMSTTAKQPSLLVWGRIQNGVPILEPAFELDAIPEMPSSSGPNRITAFDANGGEVLSFSFSGKRVADLPGDNESFSFVVPLSALRGRAVASLRLSARGRTATNVASAVADADPGVVASRPAPGRVRLQWNAARFPVLMVRNRATGNVIALARGGDATLVADPNEIEINASNRTTSRKRNIRLR